MKRIVELIEEGIRMRADQERVKELAKVTGVDEAQPARAASDQWKKGQGVEEE